MTRVGVLAVHGIGAGRSTGPERLEARVRAALGSRSEALYWHTNYWQQWDLQPCQDALYQTFPPLGLMGLRRHLVGSIADAIATQATGRPGDIYTRVRTGLLASLDTLFRVIGPNAPLLIVGHSLGTILCSNLIWDVAHSLELWERLETPGLRLETLRGFYSLGSPIALWCLRWPNYGVPISVPYWVNIYDPYDPVATPLQCISASYRQAVTEDLALRPAPLPWLAPGLRAIRTHQRYWTHPVVVSRLAEHIAHLTGE
jgi:hypothetical protein